MTIFEAFLQGVLQGFTEFLPVSSSGHLSLFQYFTGNSGDAAFLFSILLHAGTLIAVCVVFWRTIWDLVGEALALLRDLFTGRFKTRDMSPGRRMILFLLLSLLPLFLVLLMKDQLSGFSTDNDITVEGFCFLLTGSLLLFASKHDRGHKAAHNMTGRDALAIGGVQLFATVPGISRSGSTISMGMLCGLERSYAVSYSFILGIPVVMGAIVLQIGDAVEQGITLPLSILFTGLITAMVFGILSIKLVQWVVKGNKLHYFGYYTLALGTLVIAVGVIDQLSGHMLQRFFTGAA